MFLTIVKMAVRVGIIMRMPEQQLRIIKPVPTPNKGPLWNDPEDVDKWAHVDVRSE